MTVTGDITLNKGGDVLLKDKVQSLLHAAQIHEACGHAAGHGVRNLRQRSPGASEFRHRDRVSHLVHLRRGEPPRLAVFLFDPRTPIVSHS